MVSTVDRSEIAFFDLETTVPTRFGQGFTILEFGSILVCPRKLVELENYSTLVRPHDLSLISNLSVRANGITHDAVVSAPTFSEIADRVYDILDGRIWAGHNILRFDCVRLREAFAQINRPAPEPKGTIDSLALLTQKFGRRAGDMKMATLATYFGLGQQKHRSLDDVRLNLEVLKYCATVLFLESSLPDIFTVNNWVSPNAVTRNRSDGKASIEGTGANTTSPSYSGKIENPTSSSTRHVIENHPIASLMTPAADQPDPFVMGQLADKMEGYSIHSNDAMIEESSTETSSDALSGSNEFLQPNEVSIPSITLYLVPFYRGSQKTQILHRENPLQIRCDNLKVRFGLSTKFVDYAGRPRLSFVADASSDLCTVLDACDDLAKRFMDSDNVSEWRPVVSRKPEFYSSPTIRLHLPTVAEGQSVRWTTEVYQKESSSSTSSSSTTTQRIVFSRYDVVELHALLSPGTLVDAYFSLDPYDYQQNAGIRLVAKKLILH